LWLAALESLLSRLFCLLHSFCRLLHTLLRLYGLRFSSRLLFARHPRMALPRFPAVESDTMNVALRVGEDIVPHFFSWAYHRIGTLRESSLQAALPRTGDSQATRLHWTGDAAALLESRSSCQRSAKGRRPDIGTPGKDIVSVVVYAHVVVNSHVRIVEAPESPPAAAAPMFAAVFTYMPPEEGDGEIKATPETPLADKWVKERPESERAGSGEEAMAEPAVILETCPEHHCRA
jgi:hypothetical protein